MVLFFMASTSNYADGKIHRGRAASEGSLLLILGCFLIRVCDHGRRTGRPGFVQAGRCHLPGTISGNTVLYVTAIGLDYVAMAMLRIVYRIRMACLLAASYLIFLILSFFTPAEFVPLAYDAGSVTTGALTAPVVIALALGLSSVLAGRSAVSDGFGLPGFASIGPIIAVMIMGYF